MAHAVSPRITPAALPHGIAGTRIAYVRHLMETTTETRLGLWGKLRGRLDRVDPQTRASSGPLVRGRELAVLTNARFAAIAELLRWDARRIVEAISSATPTLLASRIARKAWRPRFEVRENESMLKFIADVPGIDPESLDISLTGNRLVISGRRELEQHQGNERVHVTEREDGHFARTFELPRHVDLANIACELRDGILTVVAPIRADARTRKIHIDGIQRRS